MKRYIPELAYISLAAIATLVLSYVKGNEGYEAFISTSIALGLFVSWMSVLLFGLFLIVNNGG